MPTLISLFRLLLPFPPKNHKYEQRLRRMQNFFRPNLERLEGRDLPSVTEFPAPSTPFQIARGTDGNIYSTGLIANTIQRTTPDGTTTSISTGSGTHPLGITGAALAMYFTDADSIGKLDLDTQTISHFALPTNSHPTGGVITAFGYVWYTDANGVGRLDTDTGIVTLYAAQASNSYPLRLTVGADHNIWFTESNGNCIARLNPVTGNITEFPLPESYSVPVGVTPGPDGNIWFVSMVGDNGDGVYRITMDGILTAFHTPTAWSEPQSIVTGADGNLYVVEYGAGKLARVTPEGVITEIALPTSASGPYDITTDGGSGLWVSENSANKIAKLNIDLPLKLYSPGDLVNAEADQVVVQLVTSGGTGSQPTFAAIGLPSGITIDPLTGLLSGVVNFTAAEANDGIYMVTLSATGGGQTDSIQVQWVVTDTNRLLRPDDQASREGQSISFQVETVVALGNSAVFSATGLPDGLSINPTTGAISGTIASVTGGTTGATTVVIDVFQNGVGDSQTLKWIVLRGDSPVVLFAINNTLRTDDDLALYDPSSPSQVSVPARILLYAPLGTGIHDVEVFIGTGAALDNANFQLPDGGSADVLITPTGGSDQGDSLALSAMVDGVAAGIQQVIAQNETPEVSIKSLTIQQYFDQFKNDKEYQDTLKKQFADKFGTTLEKAGNSPALAGAQKDPNDANRIFGNFISNVQFSAPNAKGSIIQQVTRTFTYYDNTGKAVIDDQILSGTPQYMVEGWNTLANGDAQKIDTHVGIDLSLRTSNFSKVEVVVSFTIGDGLFGKAKIKGNYQKSPLVKDKKILDEVQWLGKTKQYQLKYTLFANGSWQFTDTGANVSLKGKFNEIEK
ncbi:MAG: putative Ig domain-containing protein [Gemmataceae bacterium]|nr:putative Ig domain-containing protein [Gemmataceae bacterium]